MISKKFILGGGISSLIFAYYNRDYTIISPDIGGQLNMNFSPPKIIHANKYTEKLLVDLGLSCDLDKATMRYVKDRKILERLTNEDRLNFINKKMCEFDKPYNAMRFDDTKLSVEENYINHYKTPMNDLMLKLKESVFDYTEHMKRKVILINTTNKTITLDNYETIPYSHIVSTMPANDFCHIAWDYAKEKPLRYIPVTYIYADSLIDYIADPDSADWWYICDRNVPFNRISKINGNYVYECTGLMTRDVVEHIIGPQHIVGYSIQRVGVIFTNEMKDTESIMFLGRLAQYHHSVKIQDVIEKSIRGVI